MRLEADARRRSNRLETLGTWALGERRPPAPRRERSARPARDLGEAIEACGLRDGSTVSFHHHFRNGDRTMVAVLEMLAAQGLRGLTVAASSIFPAHAPLVPLIHAGVIARIVADYIAGPVGQAVTQGALPALAVLQSHGGRARAIASGELAIDAAFIGAPLAHASGAATGRGGRLACGPLGYGMVDAAHARTTVVLADEISENPLDRIDIPAGHVDILLPFAGPGDPSGIRSGATVVQANAASLAIAQTTVAVIEAAGLIRPGFAFQSGAGGYSLSAVPAIGRALARHAVAADFISGGITGANVAMLEEGLARRLRDVQSFDLEAVQSSIRNGAHEAMSAEDYASPGHPDAAQGAALSIVTTTLTGGGFAKLVENVACVTTPGRDIDVVVTDEGIAVNPLRPDLAEDFSRAGLAVEPIDVLVARATAAAQRWATASGERPVIVVEHREGGPLDVVFGG